MTISLFKQGLLKSMTTSKLTFVGSSHEDVPKGYKATPSVWAMRLKCNLVANKFKSDRAQLNFLSDKQVHGVTYF